jgi:very-short-patch-repair endonuclease
LGENIISEILSSKNIKYFEQKSFDGLKYKSNLYFDFYLPDYNLCIEFDGMQHKKAYYFFGGENALKERVLRDEIKNNYCKSNNINLLRLNFQVNYLTKERISKNIEEKIFETLNDCKI